LIEEPERQVVAADRAVYDEWVAARARAQEAGSLPSVRMRPVTEWARERGAPEVEALARDVTLVEAALDIVRPTGPRFGTLVHATLASVALDATEKQVADSVALQARILGAPDDEVTAATAVVTASLAHPLLGRAREAWRAGRCRRETPVAIVQADGSLLEGVLDLAWEDDEGWTVVDFKTDADLASVLGVYRRQVALYASVVAATTGRGVRAVLMRV
jgi:ATP-dependent exoDNAse (exonuclease V) beta subunit